MGIMNHPAAMPMPASAIADILARFDRGQLEDFVSTAIDMLDAMDGDCDLEDGHDMEEDDFREVNGHFIRPPEYGVDQTAGILNERAIFRNERIYDEIEYQLARRAAQ